MVESMPRLGFDRKLGGEVAHQLIDVATISLLQLSINELRGRPRQYRYPPQQFQRRGPWRARGIVTKWKGR